MFLCVCGGGGGSVGVWMGVCVWGVVVGVVVVVILAFFDSFSPLYKRPV